jgi:hypothetical protein
MRHSRWIPVCQRVWVRRRCRPVVGSKQRVGLRRFSPALEVAHPMSIGVVEHRNACLVPSPPEHPGRMAQVKGEAVRSTHRRQTNPKRRRRTWSHPPRVLWRAFDRSEECLTEVKNMCKGISSPLLPHQYSTRRFLMLNTRYVFSHRPQFLFVEKSFLTCLRISDV